MKLQYISYDKDLKLNNATPNISADEVRKITSIAKDIFKKEASISLIALPFNDKFIFTKEFNSLIYFIVADTNPYLYLDSKIIEVASDYIVINRRLPSQELCNSINFDYEVIEEIVQAIIDNIFNDSTIYLDNCNEASLKIILSLIPSSYLKHLSYSNDYETKIRLNKRSDFYFNLEDSSINNHLAIKRYAYTVVDNLKISFNNACSYADEIDKLILKKKISISSVCDLLNLIDGKLERIPTLSKLSEAVGNLSGMDYNEGYIANLIFTRLGNYEIDKSILPIYKLVYKNVLISHSEIIASFFNNLALFLDLNNLSYLEYLDKILAIIPFPLIDYLSYLKENNLYNNYFINSFNDFNSEYFLLEMIIRDIKENNGAIVPNEELLYFIDYNIYHNSLDRLKIILKRIALLNKKAPDRLLNIEVDRILKDTNSLAKLSLDTIFMVLEMLEPSMFIHYLIKLYFIKNNIEIIDMLNLKEANNPRYYAEVIKLLKSDIKYSELINLKATRSLYNNKNITLDSLNEYYNDYYLDKRRNDNGIFLDKLMLYLKKKNSLELTIDIYNRYYKKLMVGYKDVIEATIKLNDFIFSFYDIIYTNPLPYIEALDSINDKLILANKGANSYYGLLKIGEGLKNGSDNLKESIINNLVYLHSLEGFKDEALAVFLKYYSSYLYLAYFDILFKKGYSDYSFIPSFRAIFDPLRDIEGFSETMLAYFKNNSYNEGELFYFILASANINIIRYKRISLNILSSMKKKLVKKYFKDYMSYLHSDSISIDYKNKLKSFIFEYSDNNLGFILKLLLMIKNR